MTSTKLCSILAEIVICAVHPIPGQFPSQSAWNSSSPNSSVPFIPIEVALGLPSMSASLFVFQNSSIRPRVVFARLYLACRFLLFRSHLVHNASSQSLGYLNQVSMDFFFLIRTYLEQWPTRCLILVCTLVFFLGSWSLRACNYQPSGAHMSIFDGMWLFIVTFTTVGSYAARKDRLSANAGYFLGYGDLIPSTYCGRGT